MHYYHLEPYGLETAEVESFVSYLMRLSFVHGVSVPTFLKHLKRSDGKQSLSFLASCETSASPSGYHTYSNPSKSVSDLVDLVQYAVDRQDLRCTTLLSIQNIAWHTTLNYHSIRWCPICWMEDLEFDREPYLRLIWTFKEVDRCHKHRSKLISRCGSCFEKISVGSLSEKMHICSKCEFSLVKQGEYKREYTSTKKPNYADLLDFVTACSSDPSLNYREDKVRSLLLSIVAKSVEIEFEQEFWDKFTSLKGDWKNVLRGRRISFLQMRRFASRLGISLPGLLEANPECWTSQLDPEWAWDLPSPIVVRQRNREKTYLFAEEKVRNYISQLPLPASPSLKRVAEELEFSVGGLEYNFPELCSEIKRQYRRRLGVEKNDKKIKAEIVVKAYMSDPFTHKSKKIAVAKLMQAHGLPKNLLREILKEY